MLMKEFNFLSNREVEQFEIEGVTVIVDKQFDIKPITDFLNKNKAFLACMKCIIIGVGNKIYGRYWRSENLIEVSIKKNSLFPKLRIMKILSHELGHHMHLIAQRKDLGFKEEIFASMFATYLTRDFFRNCFSRFLIKILY